MLSFPHLTTFAGPVCFDISERDGILILSFLLTSSVVILGIMYLISWLIVKHRKTQNKIRGVWTKVLVYSIVSMFACLLLGLFVASDEIIQEGYNCGESVSTAGGTVLSLLSVASAAVATVSVLGYALSFSSKVKK